MTLEEIRTRTVNHYAGWWTILGIDPIAFRIVWVLQRVLPNISPNAITTASLVVGCLAAVMLARGEYLMGGLLYQLSFLLDCIDGKMARIQQRGSPFGSFYDGFVNSVVYCASLIGLGVSQLDSFWMLGGVAGALLIHVAGQDMAYYQKAYGGASSARPSSNAVGVIDRLKENKPLMWPDRHLLVFLILPVMGFPVIGVMANSLADSGLQLIRFISIVRSRNTITEK